MDSSSARGPFGFRLQSSSPVLGCLVAMVGLTEGLTVAFAAPLVALIMPLAMRVMRLAGRAGKT